MVAPLPEHGVRGRGNRSAARQAALSVALELVQLVRLRTLARRADSREFGELPQRGTYGVGCYRS